MKSKTLRFAASLIALVVLSLIVLRMELVEGPSAAALQSSGVSNEKGTIASGEARHSVDGSELEQQINQMIDESPFRSARWGISVVSLPEGRVVYERDADKQFIPASNMKIYTTGVALELLGADYRWRTSAYATGQPSGDGTIQGDLILYGRGAPDLTSQSKGGNNNSLDRLAENLHARGIKRINGNVIGDESYFRGNLWGDGWQWNDIQWYFGAEASALSVNNNEIDVNLFPPTSSNSPPQIKANDPEGYIQLDNRMAAGSGANRSTIGVHRALSENRIEVWGEFDSRTRGFGVRLAVHNPALWAAKMFLAELRSRGIQVNGKADSRNARVAPSQRFDPASAVDLAYVTSPPLSEIAKITNKDSNNLYAELVLRTLGRERAAMLDLPDPPGRERGDDEAGLALIRVWLARIGALPEGTALHDGSGLSRLNLVTPGATTRLLTFFSQAPSGRVFEATLPISGQDGTLSGRLKTVAGRVHAKTGSLTYTSGLSGYINAADGGRLAFAIFCNDYSGRGNSARLTDQIVALLAGDRPTLSKPPQKPNKTH
jgi:D-alanyl-D-alanine carboxypeptidase/D-alanyl-D-alanine-endopeptidase (penicillin-binding protein 4)